MILTTLTESQEHIFQCLKARQLHMMPDLNCDLFKIEIQCNVRLSYVFVRMTHVGHKHFCLNSVHLFPLKPLNNMLTNKETDSYISLHVCYFSLSSMKSSHFYTVRESNSVLTAIVQLFLWSFYTIICWQSPGWGEVDSESVSLIVGAWQSKVDGQCLPDTIIITISLPLFTQMQI